MLLVLSLRGCSDERVVLRPPYGIGGKPNVREAGGCFTWATAPPVSLREPSPLFHRGDTAGEC
jgi:hypothetical protein